jgi:hypothetical protein
MVWSNVIQKVPFLGRVYKENYFAWKRAYLNVLRRWRIRPGPDVVHWLCTYRCNARCVSWRSWTSSAPSGCSGSS